MVLIRATSPPKAVYARAMAMALFFGVVLMVRATASSRVIPDILPANIEMTIKKTRNMETGPRILRTRPGSSMTL